MIWTCRDRRRVCEQEARAVAERRLDARAACKGEAPEQNHGSVDCAIHPLRNPSIGDLCDVGLGVLEVDLCNWTGHSDGSMGEDGVGMLTIMMTHADIMGK